MRAQEFVIEAVDADHVLQYVKRAHAPEKFDIEYSITDHPEWELTDIPLSQLNLDPDGEAQDPYNRVNWVDDDKVQELIPRIESVLKNNPIVVDPAGWIIDGNHRAMAAVEAGMTSVPALVPVKQGVAEGTEQKPVVIYTNHRGATIDDDIKKSLRTTQEPFNKLQMWEKHKSMKDPKIADWVTNKLLPELKQNGVLKPLLVWNNNGQLFVIDGNHRFLAYQEAGYRGRVPVQIVPDNMIIVSDTVPGQQGVAENMDHSQDDRAVAELKSALLAKRDQLQSATDDQVYDIIDRIMTRIARSHSISGKKLHDMWVDRYKQIPDTWIMNEDVPQPGPSSGAPKKFGPDAKIQTSPMTVKQIISSIPDVPYYNNVVDDWDAKDYSWGVTKKVIEYATYLKQHPESLSQLPPVIVLNGKFEDGAHRVSAIWLLQQRMDPKNPLWANAKLNVQFVQQGVLENFADGRVKGKSRPGRVKRAGASCAGSVTDLRRRAKNASGEKAKMYHWCANMKSGRKKTNEVTVAVLTLGEFTVNLDDHALDRAQERRIKSSDIDTVLKKIKLPRVIKQVMALDLGSRFYVLDHSSNVALGFRRIGDKKLVLKTVYPGRPMDHNIAAIITI